MAQSSHKPDLSELGVVMRRGTSIAVLLLLAVAGVLCSLQLKVATAEKQTLERELAVQRRAVAMGRAAAVNAARLRTEQRECRQEIARLRQALPEELGTEGFVEHASEVAARHGVTLVAGERRLEHNEFYDTATIAVDLQGEGAGAALAELRGGPRLVGAEGLEQDGGGARGRLLLFASPAVEHGVAYRPARLQASSVWLPGVRRVIADLRSEVEAASAEAAALQEPISEANRLTALREEREELHAIVRELTARYGAAATSAEAVPSTEEEHASPAT